MKFISILIAVLFLSGTVQAEGPDELTLICVNGECPLVLNIAGNETALFTDNPQLEQQLAVQGIQVPSFISLKLVSTEEMSLFKSAAHSKASEDGALTPYDNNVTWSCTWKAVACYSVLTTVDSMITWGIMAGTCSEAVDSCLAVKERYELRQAEIQKIEEEKAKAPSSGGSDSGSSSRTSSGSGRVTPFRDFSSIGGGRRGEVIMIDVK